MSLDLFRRDRPLTVEATGLRPVPRLAAGLGENFGSALEATRLLDDSLAETRNRFDFVQQHLDWFRSATGENLSNPEIQLTPEDTKRAYAYARKRFDEYLATHEEADMRFPSEEEIAQAGIRRARAARQRAGEVAAVSPGFMAGSARALGMMAGAISDPVNFAAMAFGAGAASGVLRTALVEGAIGMGSQAVIEGVTAGYKREVDPGYGLGDAAANIAAAGAGGAILGGGMKGIAALWSRLKASPWSRVARDAGHVVERDAVVATPPDPPPERGGAAETAHRAAVEKATEDLFAERPVQLPPESAARTESRLNRVFDADGRAVDVRYEVIDASRLTTSHLDDFAENPAFPPDLQPRDRDRAQAQTQVAEMASRLEPDRLGVSPSADSGAPIVGPDGFVESGNGRVMAIRRAYGADGEAAARYRDFLRRQGFDTAGMDQPVMIARRVSRLEQDQRVAFVTAANRSSSLRLSAAEQALADARLLDGATLDRLKPGDVGSAANRDFVRAFASRLAPGERGDLFDADGALSKPGQQRLTAALMGRAYGETAFLGRALEDADSNIRTVAGAMADSAGAWARLRDAAARGDIPKGMDVTADLLEAVRTVMRARDTREPVMVLANQAEMFGGPSEVSKLLLRAMFSDENLKRQASRQKIANVLDDYAAEAMKNEAGPRLFGEPLAPDVVLATALRRSDRADLFTVAAERTTQDAAEKIAADPATMDAVILEADRLRATQEGVTVPVVEVGADGIETVTERSLDDLFDEADAEIAAARDIEACATGKPTDQE